jgi:hypothetical protein
VLRDARHLDGTVICNGYQQAAGIGAVKGADGTVDGRHEQPLLDKTAKRIKTLDVTGLLMA